MFKTDYPFWVVFLLMEWKTLWLCWLCWTSPSSSFLQTCWREWLQVVIVPSDACLHMLPLPLSAAWEDDDRTTEKLARWTVAQKPRFHEVSGQIFNTLATSLFSEKTQCERKPFSKSPVLLNLPLLFSLIFLSPTLWAEALPGCVAIKPTSFFAEQLRLVHMDTTSLAHRSSVTAGEPERQKNVK